MSWFKHRHYWRQKTGLNTIKCPVSGTTGGLMVDDCQCGAVRTIEFFPGETPKVRIVEPETRT